MSRIVRAVNIGKRFPVLIHDYADKNNFNFFVDRHRNWVISYDCKMGEELWPWLFEVDIFHPGEVIEDDNWEYIGGLEDGTRFYWRFYNGKTEDAEATVVIKDGIPEWIDEYLKFEDAVREQYYKVIR